MIKWRSQDLSTCIRRKVTIKLLISKKTFFFFAHSIFLHNFARVNHVWTLSDHAGCGLRGGAPRQKSAIEGKRVAHEEQLDGGELIYDEGVYLTLCSWRLETSQTFIVVRNEATVDVHGCVFTSRRYTLLYIRYAKGAIYIQAWASALLVQLRWAMRRPPSVGRVTRVPRFFCILLFQKWDFLRM
jgi:hypothetical protein